MDEEKAPPAKRAGRAKATTATARPAKRVGRARKAGASVSGEKEEEKKGEEVGDKMKVQKERPAKPAPPGRPGNRKIEVVFSFDTTGSMFNCLTQVRKNIQESVKRLFSDIPDIRIGIIAHGSVLP